MTLLIAIEGADGAGKATAAANVCDQLSNLGFRATVISFPRYSQTVGGVALGEFLSGRLPVSVTPHAAAVLYALDRLESVQFVRQATIAHDVVILDRYIASNMVYQAAKVDQCEAKDMMDWIYRLEVDTFGITPPDMSFYLDTPFEIARELMLRKKKRSYTERQYDEHEADTSLQLAVRRNYAAIAEAGLGGQWKVITTAVGGMLREPREIASEMADYVLDRLRGAGPIRANIASRA